MMEGAFDIETERELNCSQQDFSNKTCFKFSKGQFDAVIWTKTGVSSLSAVACCLAILLIVFMKAYRRFVHRLTLYLAIAAFIYSVIFALQVLPVKDKCDHVTVTNEKLCTALGFLVEYSAWVMLLFMCWITLHLFLLGVLQINWKSWQYETVGLILAHTCPVIFAVVPFIDFKNGTMYGLAGAWCWIRVTDENCNPYTDGMVEQFVLWYAPLMALVLANFLAMLVLVVVLYRGSRAGPGDLPQLQRQYKDALKEARPLLFYPIFFNILCCMAFANRVYYAVTEKTNFGLWMAHAIADPSLPLFIPLAFLLHPYTLRKLRCSHLHKVASKWWKRDSLGSHTHFVVSKKDSCSTSEEKPLIIGASEGTASSGYQSFMDVQSFRA